jgi:hypothetical protein
MVPVSPSFPCSLIMSATTYLTVDESNGRLVTTTDKDQALEWSLVPAKSGSLSPAHRTVRSNGSTALPVPSPARPLEPLPSLYFAEVGTDSACGP